MTRNRRLTILAGATVAALAVVAVLIAVSQSGGDDDESGLAAGNDIKGVPTVNRLYDGIPQDGATLGNPDAPATMVEFVDLQCPFCAEYTRDALPAIVKRYVRAGKLKLELRPVAILGPDSATGAAAAAAAAQDNRIWQFADLWYLNQGRENSGYVDDAFLRRIARGAGVSPASVISASESPGSIPLLRQAVTEAQRYNISSTPSFLLSGPGRKLGPLAVSSLEPSQFTTAIDQVLGQ
jgi:protein-disulfide isomerase